MIDPLQECEWLNDTYYFIQRAIFHDILHFVQNKDVLCEKSSSVNK